MNVSKLMTGDCTREHMMRCLAIHISKWSPSFREAWLKDWSKTHSAKLTDWLRRQALAEQDKSAAEKAAKVEANKTAAQAAIDECRRVNA